MPEYIEKNVEFLKSNLSSLGIVFVTATDLEKKALHAMLRSLENADGIISVAKDLQTYFLARFGKYNIVHVACGDMGSIGRESSITTTVDAIKDCSPKAIFMIGIAFGVDRKKQKNRRHSCIRTHYAVRPSEAC